MEQEKKEVKPDEWESMTFDQLLTQKSILLDRYEFMVAKGYTQPAKLMLEGIAKIDALIIAI